MPFILDTALGKWTEKDQADEMIMRPAVSSRESRISDKCPWYTQYYTGEGKKRKSLAFLCGDS